MLLALLAQYRPFVHPLPGAWDYWPLLAVPLCAAVAVVWKSIKCHSMRSVPREAAAVTLWILVGMVAAGAVLGLLARWAES